MSEHGLSRYGGPAMAGVVVLLALLLLGAAAGEEELFRQVKIDVFDQEWPAVLAGCEELLARFPDSAIRQQVAFYRARALSRMLGREGDAIRAFREFLASDPDDTLLTEEAWSGLFTLACPPRRPASARCTALLKQGLANRSAFVWTLAAIRAADVDDEEVRRKALPALKRAYATQTDDDIRNEILIAILKIDPSQVPEPDPCPSCPPATRGPAAGKKPAKGHPGPGGEPALIRMTIYNKEQERYELKVQFPVAFARMLIDSLGDARKRDLHREAQRQGIDLDQIFETIRRSGAGRLLQVDTDDSRIEIWIE